VNPETIKQLNAINRRFYEITAPEFDQTRGTAWSGWRGLLPYLDSSLSVLDIGCGNGRFGLFLSEHLSGDIAYHGLDNNAQLLDYARAAFSNDDAIQAKFTQHDIVEADLPDEQVTLVVLFGVIHHVPGFNQRKALMRRLANCLKPGGLLVFAAWRFYEYERFQKRIIPWDDNITVEQHDYLLDWRRGERAYRYCHYVDDAEHDALITASGLELLNTYRADGFTGDVNQYSILRKSAD